MKKIFHKIITFAIFALIPLASARSQETKDLVIFDTEDEDAFDSGDVIPIGTDDDLITFDSIDETLSPVSDYSDKTFVVDEAGILSDAQVAELEDMALGIAERHDFGVYLVTIDDYTEYGYEIEDAAEYIYDQMDLGLGNDRSGLLLLMSMKDRSYDLDAYGRGNTAFTDYGKEVLAREFLGNFRNDDWYGGFKDYYTVAENYLVRAEEGDPIDYRPETEDYYYQESRSQSLFDRVKESLPTTLLIMIPLGLILAGVGISSEKKRMNNIHLATEAGNYVQDSRINFNRNRDVYTHSTTRRIRINTQSNSGGGRSTFGGGTTIRPSGHSHHSGHF